MSYAQRSQTMLSRTADSLFWLGRYLERAEATARILDVHLYDLIGRTSSQQMRWTNEIQSLVGHQTTNMTFEDLSTGLSLDRNHDSSIANCYDRAWHNAKSARDTISLELWEAINVTHSRLKRTFVTDLGHSPHAFFAWIKDRSAMARGISDTTMNRDQAWFFLHLGRNVEQLDGTARLLQVKLKDPDEEDWVVVLRCLGGHEAYIRTVQRPVDKNMAVEFLLKDINFPKSVLFLVINIANSLEELSKHIVDPRHKPEVPASIGRLIANLKYPRTNEALTEVSAHLSNIYDAQSELHKILTDTFFAPAPESSTALPQRLEVWI